MRTDTRFFTVKQRVDVSGQKMIQLKSFKRSRVLTRFHSASSMLNSRAVATSHLNATAGLSAAVVLLSGCSIPRTSSAPRTQLRSFDHFEEFEQTRSGNQMVLLSPRLNLQPWNELVVSWNANCPTGTALKIEARAFDKTGSTRFYTIGLWSAESGRERTSIRKEGDGDALVDTDTLIARRPMNEAQVRLTLDGTNGMMPALKLITFSFLNREVAKGTHASNKNAWGRTLDVPERSQLGYAGGSGWCSPTAVSMILAYWSQRLGRPELDVPVPQVARAVYDGAYRGTGNWAFNMAYAGSFPGMLAYTTRLDDLRQVEDCIAAGIPVALSVSFDLLNGKEKDQNNGHLIVAVGFTEQGDVVVNDPWPNPKKENRVRKIFPRHQVIAAWQRSKQTVYVVAPAEASVPRNF